MSNNAEFSGIPALARIMLANPPHDDKTAVTGDGIDFIVNTKTKVIANVSGKREFAVGDHDSERLTFQMDRYIEGHDMLLSNVCRVHSFNGDTPNIYDIDDMAIDESNPDKVIFSWLLSSSAIVASGSILFALRFKCTDDADNVTYSWGTKINEDMSVFNTLENSETVVRENVDILEQWKNDLFGAGESAISDIHSAAESERQRIAQKGAETIESIPADYNMLVADVSELKGDISQLSEENTALTGRVKKIEESSGIVVVEPMDDDIPKVFLNGDEYGNMTIEKNEVNMEMDYVSKTEQFHSYIKIKFQGASSLNHPKKNFTIKLYSDELRDNKMKKLFKDWKVENHKYVLKANYIDHSHARNIVCANLWTDVVASRSDYGSLPEELRNSPKNGAIDGFPVKVYVNGVYQGIYTWNIGKDDWMWGMDEYNPNHVLLCGETNTNGTFRATPCNFRSLWSGTDGTDWSVEVGTNSSSVKNSLNALISCVKDTDDETFKATIGNYLDVQSAIDYYIHQYVICGYDGLGKNILIGTYDLVKWIFGAYDMDSVLGNAWSGGISIPYDYACPEDYQEQFNLLFERIEKLFLSELKARYSELRKTVYSFSNMYSKFEYFMDLIGSELYAEDLEVYSGIKSDTDIKQIRDYIRNRLEYCDSEFGAMVEPVPCTGITLDKTELTFDEITTQTLVATVEPSNTTDTVSWESDNEGVATVSNGVVTPIGKGTCTITATCGNHSASCEITVNMEEVVSYTITRTLSNCTSSSGVTSVIEGNEHVEILTGNDGYSMDGGTVTVTMGGVDISSFYSNGTLTIPSVTGDIVINATAKKVGTDIPLYTLASGEHTFSDGTVVTISSGNHVKIVTGSKAVSGARINILNVSQNTETITNTSNIPNTPSVFRLGAINESVVCEKYNTVCSLENNTGYNMSVFFNKAETTYSLDFIGGHLIHTDSTKTNSSHSGSDVAGIGTWFNAPANTTLEFDLKITVGEQRYI